MKAQVVDGLLGSMYLGTIHEYDQGPVYDALHDARVRTEATIGGITYRRIADDYDPAAPASSSIDTPDNRTRQT